MLVQHLAQQATTAPATPPEATLTVDSLSTDLAGVLVQHLAQQFAAAPRAAI
jgi:hypothetical protein